nr:MAG TPA: hypothetical protein [Caudoviricetes sp.]
MSKIALIGFGRVAGNQLLQPLHLGGSAADDTPGGSEAGTASGRPLLRRSGRRGDRRRGKCDSVHCAPVVYELP